MAGSITSALGTIVSFVAANPILALILGVPASIALVRGRFPGREVLTTLLMTPLLVRALSLSDHVLIPVQGSAMDAQGAAHVLEVLGWLAEKARLHVPHSVVLSRVNPLVSTRALTVVRALLATRKVHVLDTPIVERAAFRDVFDLGGTLEELDPARVSNLDKARENARAYAHEVLSRVWSREAMAPAEQAATTKSGRAA